MTRHNFLLDTLPATRGRLRANVPLAPQTWFRVGGVAEVLFRPADETDLAEFLQNCPADVPVQVIGASSNLIIRDGGVRGVVIKLGGEFGKIEVIETIPPHPNPLPPNSARAAALHGMGERESYSSPPLAGGVRGGGIVAGAAALDITVAQHAAEASLTGLEFLSGIPGTIGGALRMNAGAYGSEVRDILHSARTVDRQGNIHTVSAADLNLTYRHSGAPADWIFTSATFIAKSGNQTEIQTRMAEIKSKREETQPVRSRTGGSTFANPDGHKAWQLIDAAGCRGLKIGGAQVSELHCNFLLNTGDATAADLENLGEEVRRRVFEHSGIELRWEIQRIGVFGANQVKSVA
jgi:UDP-N-acetylmuramate dehydrogenase